MCVCVCVCVRARVRVCWGRIGASCVCVCVGQGCKPPIGVNVSSALCLSKTLISLRGVPPLLSNSSPTRTLTPLSFTVPKPLTLRLGTLLFHHLQTRLLFLQTVFRRRTNIRLFFFFFSFKPIILLQASLSLRRKPEVILSIDAVGKAGLKRAGEGAVFLFRRHAFPTSILLRPLGLGQP